MGVTIECKKTYTSFDFTYSGFYKIRKKIAELINQDLANHYNLLINKSTSHDEEWWQEYDTKLKLIIKQHNISKKIIDFLYSSDCEGHFGYGTSKLLLKVIGNYDDNYIYGYAGWGENAAKFKNFVQILQESVDTKSNVVWR